MNKNNISSIVFLPVCKKCLKIIRQEVDCKQYLDIINDKRKTISADYYLTPERCPHCNAWIDSIEIPTKLPFNTIEYFRDDN